MILRGGLTPRRGAAEEEEKKQGRGLEKGMERCAEVPLRECVFEAEGFDG